MMSDPQLPSALTWTPTSPVAYKTRDCAHLLPLPGPSLSDPSDCHLLRSRSQPQVELIVSPPTPRESQSISAARQTRSLRAIGKQKCKKIDLNDDALRAAVEATDDGRPPISSSSFLSAAAPSYHVAFK
eukprot:tig00000792_g4207.t1